MKNRLLLYVPPHTCMWSSDLLTQNSIFFWLGCTVYYFDFTYKTNTKLSSEWIWPHILKPLYRKEFLNYTKEQKLPSNVFYSWLICWTRCKFAFFQSFLQQRCFKLAFDYILKVRSCKMFKFSYLPSLMTLIFSSSVGISCPSYLDQ